MNLEQLWILQLAVMGQCRGPTISKRPLKTVGFQQAKLGVSKGRKWSPGQGFSHRWFKQHTFYQANTWVHSPLSFHAAISPLFDVTNTHNETQAARERAEGQSNGLTLIKHLSARHFFPCIHLDPSTQHGEGATGVRNIYLQQIMSFYQKNIKTNYTGSALYSMKLNIPNRILASVNIRVRVQYTHSLSITFIPFLLPGIFWPFQRWRERRYQEHTLIYFLLFLIYCARYI